MINGVFSFSGYSVVVGLGSSNRKVEGIMYWEVYETWFTYYRHIGVTVSMFDVRLLCLFIRYFPLFYFEAKMNMDMYVNIKW